MRNYKATQTWSCHLSALSDLSVYILYMTPRDNILLYKSVCLLKVKAQRENKAEYQRARLYSLQLKDQKFRHVLTRKSRVHLQRYPALALAQLTKKGRWLRTCRGLPPLKRNWRNTLDYSTLVLQTEESNVEALLYSKTKRQLLMSSENSHPVENPEIHEVGSWAESHQRHDKNFHTGSNGIWFSV